MLIVGIKGLSGRPVKGTGGLSGRLITGRGTVESSGRLMMGRVVSDSLDTLVVGMGTDESSGSSMVGRTKDGLLGMLTVGMACCPSRNPGSSSSLGKLMEGIGGNGKSLILILGDSQTLMVGPVAADEI